MHISIVLPHGLRPGEWSSITCNDRCSDSCVDDDPHVCLLNNKPASGSSSKNVGRQRMTTSAGGALWCCSWWTKHVGLADRCNWLMRHLGYLRLLAFKLTLTEMVLLLRPYLRVHLRRIFVWWQVGRSFIRFYYLDVDVTHGSRPQRPWVPASSFLYQQTILKKWRVGQVW